MTEKDGADEAARLEAALHRIARAAAGRPPAPPALSTAPATSDTSELARRLDALIGNLKEALAPPAP